MPRLPRCRLAAITLGVTVAAAIALSSAYSQAAPKPPTTSSSTLATLRGEVATQQSEIHALQLSVTQLRTTLAAVQTTANQAITSYNTLVNSYNHLVPALDKEFSQLGICVTTETQDINEGSYDSSLTYVSSVGPGGACFGDEVPADPNSPDVHLP